MKARINLQMAQTLLKAAENKLNQLYEDKDKGLLTDLEFTIKASECSGIFVALANESNALVQDCLQLVNVENNQMSFESILNVLKQHTQDSVSLENLLRNRKGIKNN